MKTLDAGQSALLESPTVAEIVLVKLTTYTSRLLGTVQNTRYFSDAYRLFDWANEGTVRQFEPWLVAIATYRDTMHHLPAPDGGGLESTLRRTRKMILRNALPESDSYLYPTLRADNLEFARVEIASLLLDKGAGQDARDLTNLTGAEPTYLFRGVVAAVARVSDAELELDLESELPTIPWLYADEPTQNDPRDTGKPLPIVYGLAKRVACVGWDVGRVTTLAADCTSGATSITVTSDDELDAAGSAYLGNEQITWTSVSGNVLSGVTRGANGTSAVAHSLGDSLIQFTTASTTFVLAGHELSALTALYVQRDDSQTLARVTSAFTTTLADTTTIPGSTIATVSFTAAQLALLAGPDGILGLRLFADVSGPVAPLVYTAGYAFDEGTSWSVANGTQTSDTSVKSEGSAAQKLEAGGMTYTLRLACDTDAANWTSVVGSPTIADEATTVLVGGSLKVTAVSSTQVRFYRNFGPVAASVMRFNVYLPSTFLLSSVRGLQIQVGSTNGGGSNYKRWRFGTDDGLTVGAWNTIDIDLASTADATNGTLDVANVRCVLFYFNDVAGLGFTGNRLYLDEIYSGAITAPVMQRNATSGTVDLTAASDTYTVDVYQEGMLSGTTVRIYFSNTAGAGTTKPASYWYIDVDVDEIGTSSFVTVTKTATGVGGPASPTNVETVGVEFIGNSPGSVWVDNLRCQSASASYLAAGGALLTEAPDILRHLLTVVCTPEQSVDASWNDVGGAGYLDDNEHAIDVSVFGTDFVHVVSRLAFESRCNLLADERSTGTVYRLLAATSAYAFAAATVTVDRWVNLEEEGREANSIFNHFRFLYAYDASIGNGLDAFAGVVAPTRAVSEDIHGRRDAEPVGLYSVPGFGTASEVGVYYAEELARVASLYKIQGVPWTDAYKLERGDTFSLTPPWEGSAKKLRLIETSRREDGLFDLRAVEVT